MDFASSEWSHNKGLKAIHHIQVIVQKCECNIDSKTKQWSILRHIIEAPYNLVLPKGSRMLRNWHFTSPSHRLMVPLHIPCNLPIGKFLKTPKAYLERIHHCFHHFFLYVRLNPNDLSMISTMLYALMLFIHIPLPWFSW